MTLENKRPFSPDEFKEIYSKAKRICVDLVIKNSDGVLLTLRDIEPYKGKWHLPGGTIYFDEDTHSAAKRLAKEELGVDVSVKKLLGVIEYSTSRQNGGFDDPIALVFECWIENGKNPSLDEQATRFGYFSDLPTDTIQEVQDFLDGLDLAS